MPLEKLKKLITQQQKPKLWQLVNGILILQLDQPLLMVAQVKKIWKQFIIYLNKLKQQNLKLWGIQTILVMQALTSN